MKKSIISILLAGVAALALNSCANKEMDPLTGLWQAPTEVAFTSVTLNQVEKVGAVRSFDITWTDGTNTLNAILGGSSYFLAPTTYTPSSELKAKTFLLGQTKVNGVNIEQGSIIIAKSGDANSYSEDDVYSINAVVFTSDGTPYSLSWEGKIAFEADASITIGAYYTDTVSAPSDANWQVVEGFEKHTLLLTNAGGEVVGSLELVVANGGNLEGDYTCQAYPDKDHLCGNGYDLSAWGMGVGGTYYVADDGSVVMVNAGDALSLAAVEPGVYTVTYPDGFTITIAPVGYTPGAVTLSTVMSVTNYYEMYAAWGYEIHLIGLEISDGNVTSSYNAATYSTTYSGTGNFLKLEFYTADGKVAPGTYKPCAVGGTVGEGEFGIGYTGEYGPGSGTNWVYSEGGANEYENVLDGELTIAYADGKFTFTLSSSVVTATYTGPVEGLSVAGEDPGPVDNWDYTPGAAYNSAANLWKAVDANHSLEWYYNPNWAGEKDAPAVEFKESTYKVIIPDACSNDWNAQLWIRPATEFKLDPEKKYNFSAKVNASTDGNFYMKLYQKGVDGEFCFHIDPRVSLKAGEDYVVNFTEFTPIATPLDLLIDFSGHDANTTFYIKDITITEVGAEPAEPVALAEFLSLTDYSGYGMSMVGVELGTAGFSYVAPDYQTTWTPSYPVDGQFIKLELYSADGKIAPGTYVPSAANGTVAAGEFNLGADNGWGGFNGTSWFTVASGAATGVAVTDGTVTVSVSGNVYTIEIATSAVNAKYVGTLGPVELTEFLSLTDYSGYGMSMVGVELGTAGFSYVAPDYQTTWTPSYPVDGQFIKLELYSADGKIAPGTYVPSAANGTVATGEFNLGADNGWGGFNGTSWFTVASGAATGVAVTDGTVTVSAADDIYTIEIKTTAVNAKYVGKLSKEAAPAGITIEQTHP